MRLAKPGEINYHMFDRYSLIHVLKGMAVQVLGRDLPRTVRLALFWEIAERPLKVHYPELFPNATQDTLANMVGDVLSTTGGWMIASYLRGYTHHGKKKTGGRRRSKSV